MRDLNFSTAAAVASSVRVGLRMKMVSYLLLIFAILLTPPYGLIGPEDRGKELYPIGTRFVIILKRGTKCQEKFLR
jgi:hypothetical protein